MERFDAYLVDGETGTRREVEVLVGDDGLHLLDGGSEFDHWAFRRTRLVEDVYAGQPARFRRGKESARLTVPDASVLQAMARHTKRIGNRDFTRSSSGLRAAKWVGGLAAVLLGIYFGLPLAAEPVASLVPRSWEEGLGERIQEMALGMLGAQKSGVCRGEEGQAAIEKLVKRLAATTDTDYRFRVTVVKHKLVNAFAAPAGYIVVFKGLIDESKTPETFAGVIAHEMGHVIERHGTEGVVKAIGVGLVVGLLFGDSSSFTGVAADIATQLVSSSYGRAAEREADAIGVAMLNRLGIRGTGLAQFFDYVAREEAKRGGGGGIGRYFATHPASEERAKTIRAKATGSNPAMTAAEWAAIKRMCD